IMAAGALAAGLAVVDLAGALHVLGDESNKYHAQAIGALEAIELRFASTMSTLEKTWESASPLFYEVADWMGTTMLESLSNLAEYAAISVGAIESLTRHIKGMRDTIGDILGETGEFTVKRRGLNLLAGKLPSDESDLDKRSKVQVPNHTT